MAIQAMLWFDDLVHDLDELCAKWHRHRRHHHVHRVVIVSKENIVGTKVTVGQEFMFEVQGFDAAGVQVPLTDAVADFDNPAAGNIAHINSDGTAGDLHAVAVGDGNITASAGGIKADPFPISVVSVASVLTTVKIVPKV